MKFVGKWMELGKIRHREVTQTQKNNECSLSSEDMSIYLGMTAEFSKVKGTF